MRFFFLLGLSGLIACNGGDDKDPVGDDDDDDIGDDDDDDDIGDDDDDDDDTAIVEIDEDLYAFPSRVDGTNSASYSGQTFRQLLIGDMKSYLGGITADIDFSFVPEEGDVEDALLFYYDFDDSVGSTVTIESVADIDPDQTTWGDLSSDKNLVGKIAGMDADGQHKDWRSEFAGWDATGVNSPDDLVRHWFELVDDLAVDRVANGPALDPDSNPIESVFVSPEGVDYQQLLEKFLRGAVSYSQGTDDYLDDDFAGKGLMASHDDVEDGKTYTALEHAWDEGFGYFGAAADYPTYTDDDIADIGYADSDNSGTIDLKWEVCYGHSVNAAKRDRGAVVATDYTKQAYEGFWMGRKLLAETDGELSNAEMTELKGYRDEAVDAWEKSIAATVVHYINDTIQDTNKIGTASYDFGDHAKHWSEMKGFALSLQFNPHSPLTDADLEYIHERIGQAPELDAADADDYIDGLIEARTRLGDKLGFHDDNLGDANGENGW